MQAKLLQHLLRGLTFLEPRRQLEEIACTALLGASRIGIEGQSTRLSMA